MAVVADQPTRARSVRTLQLGANVISTRPLVLLAIVSSSILAWLFQPERSVSALAKSFGLPPLDVYSDALIRTRGWGVFLVMVLLRWITLAIVVSLVVGGARSIKQMLVALSIYAGAALSYAIPLNLGRIFLISSVDERSSIPALAVVAAPLALVILTRFFTQLLLKSFMTYSARVGWLIPALSVLLWTVGSRILHSVNTTALGVLSALLVLTMQSILLVSLVHGSQTGA